MVVNPAWFFRALDKANKLLEKDLSKARKAEQEQKLENEELGVTIEKDSRDDPKRIVGHVALKQDV